MQVVILCGGKGTRLRGHTESVPKPLVEVGDKPILWHIMKIYASHGFNEFILLLGHQSQLIKDFFLNNEHINSNWKIQFIESRLEATKSERLKDAKNLIQEETFLLAYGDDVADINIKKVIKFHEYMDTIVTLTAIRPFSSYGILEMDEENLIINFKEKPLLNHWVNGGFMVCKKEIFDYLDKGELENEVFNELVKNKQICAYKHKGSWKSMNTLKESMELNQIWNKGKAFWKVWED